jgi:hypothetical protein
VEAPELHPPARPLAIVSNDRRAPMDVAEVGELLRQTRERIHLVDRPQEAILLVRRTTAAEKVLVEALKSFRAQEHEQLELRQEVAETHIRTQRRAGELLLGVRKHRGGRPPETPPSPEGAHSRPVTLRELGVTAQESHRWQRIASIPAADFEVWVADSRAAGRDLAMARVLALAATYVKPAPAQPAQPPEDGARPATVRRQRRHPAWEQLESILANVVQLEPAVLVEGMTAARRTSELALVRRLQTWLAGLEAAIREGGIADGERPRREPAPGRLGGGVGIQGRHDHHL